jgi:hypothetical protein
LIAQTNGAWTRCRHARSTRLDAGAWIASSWDRPNASRPLSPARRVRTSNFAANSLGKTELRPLDRRPRRHRPRAATKPRHTNSELSLPTEVSSLSGSRTP